MKDKHSPPPRLAAGIAELQQRAMALYRAERRPEALAACRAILAVQPERADVMSFAGMIAAELGDSATAAEFYGRAVERRPDFAEAHYNLGIALAKLGRTEPAVEAYRRAARLRPDLVPVHNNLAIALETLGRFEEAAAAYGRALALAPEAAELHRNLGIVLQKSGRLGEAVAAFRRVVALDPRSAVAHSSLATALMEAGDHRGAAAACDAWLAVSPGKIEAIAYKAVALNALGDREGVRYLVDLERLVRVQRPPTPEGFADIAAFNAALVRHVLAHPTLHVPPEEDPHYHHPALQITGELLAAPKGPVTGFEAMINDAVASYLAAVPADRTHPFLVDPPRRWRLTSWAAVLNGQGNLLPHIHLDGYLSGVYYPLVPEMVGAPGQGEAGYLELGRPPAEFKVAGEPEIRAIRPEEGLMVLFPSYVYHRTVPFVASSRRISVAFDVIAEA